MNKSYIKEKKLLIKELDIIIRELDNILMELINLSSSEEKIKIDYQLLLNFRNKIFDEYNTLKKGLLL